MSALFWFIVLVGILIFAHETGHFLFAKAFGVKVLTFSLGFGTPIRIGRFKLSLKRGDTEYRIGWFPVGGFVRMLGDDPDEEVPPEEMHRAFPAQKVWKRFFIIFAGPAFSLALAVPIFFFLALTLNTAPAPEVGSVVPGSPAEKAGLRAGDTLKEVNGQAISTWEDVDEAVQESEGKPIEIVFVRDGERHVATTRPYHEFSEDGLELLGERWDLGLRHERRGNLIGVTDASPAYRAGLRTWDRLMGIGGVPVGNWDDIERLLAETGNEPVMVTILRQASLKAGAVEITIPLVFDLLVVPPQGLETRKERNVSIYGIEPADMYVMEVTPGLPAERNGIKPGDKLVSIDGVALKSWEQFSRAIIEGGSRPHELVVRSGTALRTITFTPETISQTNEFKQKTRKLGLGVSYIPNVVGGKYIPRPNRLSFAVKSAFTDTANAIVLNVMGFVRIFQGRVAPTEAIGGPIMIADIAAKSARKGMRHFFNMMAMLSVLLGLLNLLPIPILDGGHLLFLGIEAAMRKPLPEKVRIGASYVGFVLLAALMLFAFGNDIQRYLF